MKNTGMRFKVMVAACAAAALMGFGLFAQASDDVTSAELTTQAAAQKDSAAAEKAAAKKQDAAQLEAASNSDKAEKAEKAPEPEKAESADALKEDAPEAKGDAEIDAAADEGSSAPQADDEKDDSADAVTEQAPADDADEPAGEPADEAAPDASGGGDSATGADDAADSTEESAASAVDSAADDSATPTDDAALATAAVQEDQQEEAETSDAAKDEALLKTQSGSSITNAKVVVYGKDFWPEEGMLSTDVISSIVSGDPSRYTVSATCLTNPEVFYFDYDWYNRISYSITVTPVSGYTLDAEPKLVWVGQNAGQGHAAWGFCQGKSGNSYTFMIGAALEYLQPGVPIPKPQVVTVTYYNRSAFNEGEIQSYSDLKNYISSVTYNGTTYGRGQIEITPAFTSVVSPGENRYYVSIAGIGVPDYSYDAASTFYVIQTPTMTLDTYRATKTYRVGDTLDTAGLTVRVSGGSEDPASGLSRVIDLDDVNISISGQTGTTLTSAGTKTVTVSYNCPTQTINDSGTIQNGTKLISASYDITVKDVSSIAVSEPGTVEYQCGDALDVSNTMLMLTYTDGSTEEVAVESSMVSGFDSSKAGAQTLTVSYGGKTATYDVTVAALVTFDANGGTVTPATALTQADGTLASLPTPSRLGYDFSGWFVDGKSDAPVAADTVFTGNTTIVAQWAVHEYGISYDLAGGVTAMDNPLSYTVEDGTIELSAPTREGYTFAGWTGSNGSAPQAKVSFAATDAEDKTYTANWTDNTAKDDSGATDDAGGTSGSSSGSSSSSGANEKPDYTILDGADSVWQVGSAGNVVIRGSGDYDKFVRVLVDGVVVDPSNYSVAAGSTIVTLKASYLATLPEGEHDFEIEWTDGAAATVFTVTQAALTGGDDDDDAADADDSDDTASATSTAAGSSSPSGGKKGGAKAATAQQGGTVATSDPVFWLLMCAVALSAIGVFHTARRIRQADARFASWLD